MGAFNTYAQDILDPASALYRFAPDVVLLAIQTRDIVPELWSGYADLTAEARDAVVSRTIDSLHTCITTLRSRSQAHLIVHTLETPALPSQGVFDQQSSNGQVGAIQEINTALRQLANQQRGVYVLDYDTVVARYGASTGTMNANGSPPACPSGLTVSCLWRRNGCASWLRSPAGYARRWSSISIIPCGVVSSAKTAWRAFSSGGISWRSVSGVTTRILDLYQRGIILAVCSKNNFDDAMEALEGHPGMLLRPQHFAAWRINWQDKVQNLREIAAELNIGIDALAFLDDNPVERSHIRADLPEVTVLPCPTIPWATPQRCGPRRVRTPGAVRRRP